MLAVLIVGILILSVVTSIFQGNVEALCESILASPQRALELCIATGCSICLWSGVMEVARQVGILKGLSKLFSPLVSALFPRVQSEEIRQSICANLSANLLGLGAAAAPAGIAAVRGLQQYCPDRSSACNESILVIVLNTASLQLIPTTAAMLRLQAGSAEPMAILPAVWLTSALSITAGLIAAKFLGRASSPQLYQRRRQTQ